MPLMKGGIDVYGKNRIISDFLRYEIVSGGDTKRFSDGEILERMDKMSFIELIFTVGYIANELEVGVDDRLFSLCLEAAEKYLTLYKPKGNCKKRLFSEWRSELSEKVDLVKERLSLERKYGDKSSRRHGGL